MNPIKHLVRRFISAPPAPHSEGARYSQIVSDYFKAGNHNVVELCDAIGMTPRQLYFACDDDSVKASILPRLPESLRRELTMEICCRIFSEQPVTLATVSAGRIEHLAFHNLKELLKHVTDLQETTQVTENLKVTPPIRAYIHTLVPPSVRLELKLPSHDKPLGIVESITRDQLNLLMVNYGKLNPRGNRQSF